MESTAENPTITAKQTSEVPKTSGLEKKALLLILALFVGVLAFAWMYAMNLRQTIAASNSVVNVDPKALIEVEKIRNLSESHISASRSYFLLGSKTFHDEQRENKDELLKMLASFEKQYTLPQVPEIMRRIESYQQQLQDAFDQGVTFREQQTESRIVGQFYQSKAGPMREQINKALNEIVVVLNAELDRARAKAEESALAPQVQIPQGMTWFSILTSVLFLSMALLIVRMLRERSRQVAERNRLYDAARKAILSRDEVMSAVSQDLKEPLRTITQTSDSLLKAHDPKSIQDGAELIKGSVGIIETTVKDLQDQTKADTGSLTLRLDQQGLDSILEEAKNMLQPIAKKNDVKLQVDSVNPPVLAFFDHDRVLRVLTNLIGNAVKFSPKGSKVIVKVKSDQQYAYITVSDSGPGIPEKQQKEIFNRFWQARKTADQGAGVGLSVVKTIVEAHGGTVSVDSHIGHGSKFTFSLPRRRPVGANIARNTAPNVRMTSRQQPPAEFN